MKEKAFGLLLTAVVAGVSFVSTTARAGVFDWADGAVVDVGCQGLGDNNWNSNADTMRFLGSGTIHGTLTPVGASFYAWAIWRNYLMTNGTVVVDATDVSPYSPCFQRSVILGETGALVISNAASTTLGCTLPDKYPVYDVPNISFVTAAGAPYAGTVKLKSCTIKGYPQSGIAAPEIWEGHTVAIAGPDFMNVYGTAFTNPIVYIFDDTFIPDGETLEIGAGCDCRLAGYEIDPDLSDLLQTDQDHETRPWSALGEYAVSTHPISVAGTLTLESTCGCTFSNLVSGSGMTSAVDLPGDLTHTFEELGGTLRFGRTTGTTATVVVNAVRDGTKLLQGAGVAFQFPAGRAPVEIAVPDGTWYVFADPEAISSPARTSRTVRSSRSTWPPAKRFFLSSGRNHERRNRLATEECEEHAFLVKRGAGNRDRGLILERGGLPPLWKAGASSRTPQTGRSPSSISPPPPATDCASHQTRIRLAYPCHRLHERLEAA